MHFYVRQLFHPVPYIGGSKGGGHGPPPRPDKNLKMAQFAAFCIIRKKKFPGDMPPDPPNSQICSAFLALAAAGPFQCEHLEPPVVP